MKLEFEIRMISDYHVGSGHGGGQADSSLLRDGDGIPVIRSAAGLLRDGAWRLLQQPPLTWARRCASSNAQGDSPRSYCAPTADACPICRIFGTPAQPKRWSFSSVRPVEAQVPGRGAGRREDSQTVTRVRVNPRTRRAEPRKLFSEEHGDARLVFRFAVEIDDTVADDEAAFIVAAARVVRSLGRSRRRGLGECRIHLVDRVAEARWLGEFRSRWVEHRASSAPTTASDRSPLPEFAESGRPLRVRVIARADEPLLLAYRPDAGNEYATRQWIPGAAVLGALASRIAGRYDLRQTRAKEAFVRLILRGRLSCSPLVYAVIAPETTRLIPTIPAPLDLMTCKAFPGFEEMAHGVTPHALSEKPPGHCPECERQRPGSVTPLKLVEGFIPVHPGPTREVPRERHEMHIRIDPQLGRVGEGDLYGYVSLEGGQYFIGEIWCRDESDWRALAQMAALPEPGDAMTVRIGKATRRGHGRVSVCFEKLGDDASDPWRGLPLSARVPGSFRSDRLMMTLLTDTIVLDPWLRSRLGFDSGWLSDLLGARVEVIRAFCRTRVVDGFFGHLGLPRFRDVAMVAGSAVGLRLPERRDGLMATLEELERDGIGVRREEGFGRVVFNHPIYDRQRLPADNRIEIPASLRVPAVRGSELSEIAAFKSDWDADLAGDRQVSQHCAAPEFTAIARLLRQGAGEPIESLKSRLRNFGAQGDVPGLSPRGGPTREKAVRRDTHKGREVLVALLDRLGARAADGDRDSAERRRIGVEMLADRLARAVAMKEPQS